MTDAGPGGMTQAEVREFYVRLGANIAAERCNLGLSQAQLAGEIGIAQASLCRIERAQEEIGLTELQKLADMLGVTATSLLPRYELIWAP